MLNRAEHVTTEVHSLSELERLHVVTPAWLPCGLNVKLSPELLDATSMPPFPRPTDDYVFQLCGLFATRPSFSEALEEDLVKSREQANVVSEWAMKNVGTEQHLGDYFVGYKQRCVLQRRTLAWLTSDGRTALRSRFLMSGRTSCSSWTLL